MRMHWGFHDRRAGPGRWRAGMGGGRFGGGGFGRAFGGEGGGGPRMHAGRKMSSEDLQLLILVLIAEQPRHGYELITALEERSGGFYRPSPGMIYPSLTYLEEAGFAQVAAEGNRKSYAITAAGTKHLQAHRAAADASFAALAQAALHMARVRTALEGDGGGADSYAPLERARHALRGALRSRLPAEPGELRRITAVLERAAREIRAGQTEPDK